MDRKRVALVAGGSGEIGHAICSHLGEEGMLVYVGYCRNQAKAETIAERLGAKAIAVDVSDPDGCIEVCDQIYSDAGGIDVLVNAAAMNLEGAALGLEPDDWNAVVDVNLTGAYNISRAAARFMMLGRFGRIIHISSIVASIGGRGQINYAAAKAGMERMTQVLALELGRKGITANCVAPGVIETAMSERMRSDHTDELLDRIAVRRFGRPDEVAHAVAFIVSEEAGYINGQILGVDGGMAL